MYYILFGDYMDIIYSDNKLFVELNGRVNKYEIEKTKRRLYGILDSYRIREIILNTTSDANDELIGNFVDDYHSNYDGIIRVNYK